MKKTLLAAVLASTLSVSAFAQQTSASIYGVIDAAQYSVNSSDKDFKGLSGKAGATSRFGILVEESIGTGLKAGARLETELDPATGKIGSTSSGVAEGSFNRQANVFLDSKELGKVVVGRQQAPLYNRIGSYGNALGINSFGFLNATTATYANSNKLTGETRAAITGVTETSPGIFNSGVAYTTPAVAGFDFTVFTTPGNGTANGSMTDGGQRDYVLNFNNYGIAATYGQSTTFDATGNDFAKRKMLAGNYTLPFLPALKVYAGRMEVRYETYHDIDVQSFGVRYRLTPSFTVAADTTEAKDKTTTANSYKSVAVSGTYDMSKRTALWGAYGKGDNSGAATQSPLYGGTALTAAQSSDVYMVGLRHSF